MRCALYARYSSDRQNERSVSDQLAACRGHAEARGWTVVATFSDEAISGAAMANRPGLMALLAAAAGDVFDVLLVEDTDRLARNREHDAHVYNRLTRAGVTLATLSTDKVTVIDSALRGLMNELYLVNLGEHTARGMRANAERGLATGSRLYGYRSSPGGAIEIVPEEAEIICEAYERFGAGVETARDIAADFNRRGVPGPRGGLWNASTINGERKRGNGILWTELYAGVKVWNRMQVVKDPETGRRTPRMKPPADWRRTPVPELAIVTPQAWAAVQARKKREAGARPTELSARRQGLFSGLLKCGCCGASYTGYRRGALICAAWREKGPSVCANARPVRRADVEREALAGLQARLLSPAHVAAYVRAYHAAWTAAAARRSAERAPLERRLAEIRRRTRRALEEVMEGRGRAVRQLLAELEAEEDRLSAELARLAADDAPIALHPHAAERYAAIVGELQAWLETAHAAAAAEPPARRFVDAVQGLVLRIDIHPEGPGLNDPFRLTITGELARFLQPVADPEMEGRVRSWGPVRPRPSMPIEFTVRAA
ncbi:MAG TPA: recombinase family protein [Stellaceae bacterium]|nr:recombinase family protein [Stellaceae bacterium]